jgi:hypothetical protein
MSDHADLETAARAALEALKDVAPRVADIPPGGLRSRIDDAILALEAALAAPGVDPKLDTGKSADPAAIRRAALEEATEAIRRTPSLDLDGFVIGTMEAIAAIRALADKEPP